MSKSYRYDKEEKQNFNSKKNAKKFKAIRNEIRNSKIFA